MNEKQFDYEITPLGMLENAQVWRILYRQNIYLNTPHQIVAIYCLMIGLEMLLKSYLIFLNNEYCKHKNLKKIGHDFKLIYDALSKEKNAKFLKEIKSLMEKFKLFEFSTDILRYPKKGDAFYFSDGYFLQANDFDLLFDLIHAEIRKKIMNSFYKQ